ncbi:hypothetical protein [Microcoleus sp. herbarium12]|jgi:hypothetical protein|uniref:hypothetical protein n=1 Tax=Microcoleus sp. herbarium12 TaxID=3055437 RepID=UPI002FD2BC78
MQAAGVQLILSPTAPVRLLGERSPPPAMPCICLSVGICDFYAKPRKIYKTLHKSRISGWRGDRWCVTNQAVLVTQPVRDVWLWCGML